MPYRPILERNIIIFCLIALMSKATWIKVTDKFLSKEIVTQCQNNKKVHNVFKRKIWREIIAEFMNKTGKVDFKIVKLLETRASNEKPLSDGIIALSFIYFEQ